MNQTCTIPKLDPYSPEILKLMSEPKQIECSTDNEDWVYVDRDLVLKWTNYSTKNLDIKNIECDITYIKRRSEQKQTTETISKISIMNYTITDEFFLLSCSSSIFKKWKKHYYILIPKSVKKDTKVLNDKLNVLILGFDSISHMEAIRALPKSLKYMSELMDFVTLNGYNIVGDGTPQAYIPILTGKTEEELPLTRKRYKNKANYVNIYPFIWNNYSDSGYITGFGEDQSYIDMFSYRLKGFDKQPTNHYLKPIMNEIYKRYRTNLDCNGGTEMIVDWLNYIEDFIIRYDGISPIFGLFHHGILTHDAERAKLIDSHLYDFLKRNNERSRFNNTALFIISDHGARFTKKRQTNQGQLEERLPFFSIHLPNKYQNHQIYLNLKDNSNKLTTPFDIYSTLLDILNINKINNNDFSVLPTKPLNRSLSLLRKIPHDRTCKDADIEPHWCSCVNWKTITKDSKVYRIGQNIIDKIIKTFNNFLNEEKQLCAELKLDKIVKIERLAPDDSVLQYNGVKDADGFVPKFNVKKTIKDFITYKVTFITKPGLAKYEATVQYNEATNQLKVDAQAISHVNKYGDLPHCVIDRNYFLGSYCVCKDKLINLS